MILTDEMIQELGSLARELTPVSDIAVLLGLDEFGLREVLSDHTHPASVAYRRGKAETRLRLRRNELELAEAGSPLAVAMVKSYMEDMDNDEDL